MASTESLFTLEEYLEIDRRSETKYEYSNGRVYQMIPANKEHNQITVNLIRELGLCLKNSSSCRIYPSDQRIKVPAWPPYRYPDLSGVCEVPVFESIGGTDVLVNPALIVEILSPTTEAFDRGEKFSYYKSIRAFKEYVLVSQHKPYVTQFVRQEDGSWLHSEVQGLQSNMHFVSINCHLLLVDLYLDVDFQQAEYPLHPGALSETEFLTDETDL